MLWREVSGYSKEYRLIKQDAINVLAPYQPLIEEFNRLNDEGNKSD